MRPFNIKPQSALIAASAVTLYLCSGVSNAGAPTVSGATFTFASDSGWYQVITTDFDPTTSCQGAGGATCTVTQSGDYVVINLNDSSEPRYYYTVTLASSEPFSFQQGTTSIHIAFDNDHYYQVQDATTYSQICMNHGDVLTLNEDCTVVAGNYVTVIDFTDGGRRYENIEVIGSSVPPSGSPVSCPANSPVPCIFDASKLPTSAAFVQSGIVFEDNFDSRTDVLQASEQGVWFRDDMSKTNHQTGIPRKIKNLPGTYFWDKVPVRRWTAFYDDDNSDGFDHDDVMVTFSSNGTDDYLVQRGVKDTSNLPGWSNADPDLDGPYYDPDDGQTEEINFGNHRLYTSFFTTFDFASDQNRIPLTPNSTFTPGTYFETRVNFSQLKMGGHRHSLYLLPTAVSEIGNQVLNQGAVSYDAYASNGVEIDIYEYEGPSDSSVSNRLYMKVLGNDVSGGGTGNTYNQLGTPPTGINLLEQVADSYDYDGTTVETTPAFQGGMISEGWHTIGFYWGYEELVWFLDGVPVVVDDDLVPATEMYLVMSREMNSGVQNPLEEGGTADPSHVYPAMNVDPTDDNNWIRPPATGIRGENVGLSRNRDKMIHFDGTQYIYPTGDSDQVLVDYVKAWRVSGISAPVLSTLASPMNVRAVRYSADMGEVLWDIPGSLTGIDYYEISLGSGIRTGNPAVGQSWYIDQIVNGLNDEYTLVYKGENGATSQYYCGRIPAFNSGSSTEYAVPCSTYVSARSASRTSIATRSKPTALSDTEYSIEPPLNVKVGRATADSIDLLWKHKAQVEKISGYEVMNLSDAKITQVGFVTSHVFKNLPSDTQHQFAVRTVTDSGEYSAWSKANAQTR